MRAVIGALVEEAQASDQPHGSDLCRFGAPDMEKIITPYSLRVPVLPWQPHWGRADDFQGSQMPADICDALQGFPVDLTSCWVVYLVKKPQT